jgi:hypothetical protein
MVVIDGAALLRNLGVEFREFLLFFLLLFFLLAGIGSLETSDVNFVDLQHGFHHPLGAGGIRKEGSDFQHGYSWARKSYQAERGDEANGEIFDSRNDGACAVWCKRQSQNPHPVTKVATRVGHPRVFFRLTMLRSMSKS